MIPCFSGYSRAPARFASFPVAPRHRRAIATSPHIAVTRARTRARSPETAQNRRAKFQCISVPASRVAPTLARARRVVAIAIDGARCAPSRAQNAPLTRDARAMLTFGAWRARHACVRASSRAHPARASPASPRASTTVEVARVGPKKQTPSLWLMMVSAATTTRARGRHTSTPSRPSRRVRRPRGGGLGVRIRRAGSKPTSPHKEPSKYAG